MQFRYEIPMHEYIAGQILYGQLTNHRRVKSATWWFFLGLCLIVLGGRGTGSELKSLVLASVGAWWVYAAGWQLFPGSYFRHHYPRSRLKGKVYDADVNQNGFKVTGGKVSWQIQWDGVQPRGENATVFIFTAANTIFIFGKQYLDNEQQQELRKLSGL